ncbi:hypothetical protein BDBG_17746 [Blastomyces gilchristii SLH14081]|uniref:Uncharacterized protein n=1 Tax=Blastomyces gilchristii (strain SLH14081) TaxID=559298 RepID=A0A179UZ88_BLAGS|nr:uncharacterized protein BDBG_17746 [Blastomyces gilchristii SLH14081]OAT13160.1 hypothetical protein BDBG_17746 [Blastomyces gilchristii SLH14081]
MAVSNPTISLESTASSRSNSVRGCFGRPDALVDGRSTNDTCIKTSIEITSSVSKTQLGETTGG